MFLDLRFGPIDFMKDCCLNDMVWVSFRFGECWQKTISPRGTLQGLGAELLIHPGSSGSHSQFSPRKPLVLLLADSLFQSNQSPVVTCKFFNLLTNSKSATPELVDWLGTLNRSFWNQMGFGNPRNSCNQQQPPRRELRNGIDCTEWPRNPATAKRFSL